MFEEELGIWGNVVVLAASLAILAKASDLTINNSVRVADVTGFGKTTVGFVLVAFSTSLPELLVSIFAAVGQGSIGVAVGNVLGSNIVNVCLILGVCFTLVTLKCPEYSCLYPRARAIQDVFHFDYNKTNGAKLVFLFSNAARIKIAFEAKRSEG